MSAILDIIGDALVKAQLSWMAEHGLAGKSVSLTNHRYTAGVLEALHAAGFRIVGPEDVDHETVERCVEVANAEVAKHQGPFTSQPAYVASCAIRDALRALKEKQSS